MPFPINGSSFTFGVAMLVQLVLLLPHLCYLHKAQSLPVNQLCCITHFAAASALDCIANVAHLWRNADQDSGLMFALLSKLWRLHQSKAMHNRGDDGTGGVRVEIYTQSSKSTSNFCGELLGESDGRTLSVHIDADWDESSCAR